MKAEMHHPARDDLAEGPLWWHGALWWVDITSGKLQRLRPGHLYADIRSIGCMLGAAVPVAEDDDRWILAAEDGFRELTWSSGETTPIVNPESDRSGNRFNDGKCDPAGRFWAGTMSCKDERGMGALYVMEHDRSCRKVLSPLSISNGLAWSADGGTMYHIDTPTRQISAFDFDPAAGAISNRRVAFDFGTVDQPGFPDGMTIDTDGNLWVALWGGWSVVCVNPKAARILAKVQVHVEHVTSCCFGGPDLDTLYITTARQNLTREQIEHQHEAGSIFRCHTGARGLPTVPFGKPVTPPGQSAR